MGFINSIRQRSQSNILNFLTLYSTDTLNQGEALSGNLFLYIIKSRPLTRLILSGLGTAFAVSGMFVAYFQKQAVDELVRNTAQFRPIAYLFITAFILLCLNKILEVVVRVIGLRESNIIETWLSEALYAKALNLHYEQRNKQSTGQTIALMANHLTMISFFFTELFPPMFTSLAAILLAPLGMSIMFDLNPIAVYGVVFFALTSCFAFARQSSRLFQHYKVLDEKRLGYINEWLRNIKILKSLSWVPIFEKRIFSWTQIFTTQRIKMTGWAQFMNSFAEALPHLINFAGIGTLLFIRDKPASPGELFGLLWILGVFLTGPLKALPWIFVISLDAHASMKRIANFLNLEESENSGTDTPARKLDLNHKYALRVKGLRLELDQRPILNNIDFEVEKGHFVCVVGSVGAGKSQILNSLILSAPCTFTKYELFGQSIELKDKGWIQEFFTLAPQDAFTLGVSVSKNVHFNFEETTEQEEDAKDSLFHAAYEKDLELFQDGMHTELGEFGLNLSGGQRQRLALARAHYFTRPIVLLDDSLSAVDHETEKSLLENLIFGEWKNKTRILVTHRLSVLPHADKILFIEDGLIKAQGTYKELLLNEDFLAFVEQVNHAK